MANEGVVLGKKTTRKRRIKTKMALSKQSEPRLLVYSKTIIKIISVRLFKKVKIVSVHQASYQDY